MPIPTQAEWIEIAKTGADGVWQIGQIDKATARALDKLVRQGVLVKCRGRFCGISPLKTIWCAPGTRFNIIECVELVEVHGAAAETQARVHAEYEAQFAVAA